MKSTIFIVHIFHMNNYDGCCFDFTNSSPQNVGYTLCYFLVLFYKRRLGGDLLFLSVCVWVGVRVCGCLCVCLGVRVSKQALILTLIPLGVAPWSYWHFTERRPLSRGSRSQETSIYWQANKTSEGWVNPPNPPPPLDPLLREPHYSGCLPEAFSSCSSKIT